VTLEEHATTEPSALSESELIGLMEINGIGTDASIATHIHTIEQRKYVRLLGGTGGRRFEPTPLGLALTQVPLMASDGLSNCMLIAYLLGLALTQVPLMASDGLSNCMLIAYVRRTRTRPGDSAH
jgi:hypothetical protein